MSDEHKNDATPRTDGGSDDLSKLSLLQLLKHIKPSEIVAIFVVVSAIAGAAFGLGQKFSSDLDDLKSKNASLISSLASTEIGADKKATLSIDEFIINQSYDTTGLQPFFDDRLFLPKLPSDWQSFKANDLTLLARLIGVSEASIRDSLPATFLFNSANPPKIWVINDVDTLKFAPKDQSGYLTPYIQVSVISRTRAEELMKAINKDGNSVMFRGLMLSETLLTQNFME